MTRDELLLMLDMETPSDFGYFEQYADLVETKEIVEFDDFYYVLSEADKDIISEITVNYFEELEKFIPTGSDDIFEIVENVSNSLKLIVSDFDQFEIKREYVEKLFTFHEWYTKNDGAIVDGEECAVIDAIFTYRAGKLENIDHTYDFSNSLDYKFDYVSMPLGGFGDDNEYDK